MKIWIDAQLPPALATWIETVFEISVVKSLKCLGLRDAQDIDIFMAARAEKAIVMTKDSDFIDLVCRLNPPPQILWVTCGNITNRNLKRILTKTLSKALKELNGGAPIVEISTTNH